MILIISLIGQAILHYLIFVKFGFKNIMVSGLLMIPYMIFLMINLVAIIFIFTYPFTSKFVPAKENIYCEQEATVKVVRQLITDRYGAVIGFDISTDHGDKIVRGTDLMGNYNLGYGDPIVGAKYCYKIRFYNETKPIIINLI